MKKYLWIMMILLLGWNEAYAACESSVPMLNQIIPTYQGSYQQYTGGATVPSNTLYIKIQKFGLGGGGSTPVINGTPYCTEMGKPPTTWTYNGMQIFRICCINTDQQCSFQDFQISGQSIPADRDYDNDGVNDSSDYNPLDPNIHQNPQEVDSDGDFIPDDVDPFPDCQQPFTYQQLQHCTDAAGSKRWIMIRAKNPCTGETVVQTYGDIDQCQRGKNEDGTEKPTPYGYIDLNPQEQTSANWNNYFNNAAPPSGDTQGQYLDKNNDVMTPITLTPGSNKWTDIDIDLMDQGKETQTPSDGSTEDELKQVINQLNKNLENQETGAKLTSNVGDKLDGVQGAMGQLAQNQSLTNDILKDIRKEVAEGNEGGGGGTSGGLDSDGVSTGVDQANQAAEERAEEEGESTNLPGSGHSEEDAENAANAAKEEERGLTEDATEFTDEQKAAEEQGYRLPDTIAGEGVNRYAEQAEELKEEIPEIEITIGGGAPSSVVSFEFYGRNYSIDFARYDSQLTAFGNMVYSVAVFAILMLIF